MLILADTLGPIFVRNAATDPLKNNHHAMGPTNVPQTSMVACADMLLDSLPDTASPAPAKIAAKERMIMVFASVMPQVLTKAIQSDGAVDVADAQLWPWQ